MAETKRRLIAELAPSPHLSAADLDGDTIVTIKGDDRHPVGKEKQLKGVLYFEEFERGLVMNPTNRVLLKAATDCKYIDELPGKKITLCIGEATNPSTGQMGPCVRIRKEPPAESVKIHKAQKQTA